MSDDWNEVLSQPQPPAVSEEFDPTWPYNFKWAFDAMTGRAEVWRVQGGTDGRPVHRKEVEDRWGRPPRIQGGDVMGLATYIPAEMKIDGTVVAPPEVHTQTYYNQPTPQEITQWFQREFPHATVRDAMISRSKAQAFGKVAAPAREFLKWIWNDKDGLILWAAENDRPTHNQKALAEWNRPAAPFSEGDTLGYALPDPEKVEVETHDGSPIPPGATGALRQQLAEWFPNHQIVFDHIGLVENGDFSFNSDPADYRSAALVWAHENLRPEEPHRNPQSSDEWSFAATERRPGVLARLFSKKVTAEADMEGCMVALFVPEEAAKKLKIKGGEPIENMHITLLYFSDKAADRDDWDKVKRIVEQVANQSPPLSGIVSGYGVFNADEGDVLWASPSVQGLAELRHKIYEACEDAGFHTDTEHDWVPHITLKYKHRSKLPKGEIELDFAELSFAQGDDQHHYELTGHLEKTTSDDYLDWSGWEGAHRFVTDGKEILTDPETEPIDEEVWAHHPDLTTKFFTLYPDTKGIASGWTIPTADGMGLGIYAPAAGHGDEHEPGLHEIIGVIEKELGKPAHLITNGEHLSDEGMYDPGIETEWQTLSSLQTKLN